MPSGLLSEAGVPWAWDGGDAVWYAGHGHALAEAAEEAARLVAAAWGSRRSWLLWNGATAGVLAMVTASVPEGGRLLMPRCVHRSAVDALVLAGAEPVFLPPRWLEGWGIPLPPGPQDVAQAREASDGTPGPDAVLLTSPTYEGICADLAGIARTVHPLPLLVDEAHGAHLAFWPEPGPPSGIRSGAQLVVHGAHKTLPVLTQAGLLHWTGAVEWPDAERVERLLSSLQSTSPQPALLASLDAARAEMEARGRQSVARTVDLARRARALIEGCGPYRCLRPEDLPPGCYLDETRLVVDVSALGLPGWAAASALAERHGVWAEMAGFAHLVFILTGADDEQSVSDLVSGLAALARQGAGAGPDGVGVPGAARGRAAGRAPQPPPPGPMVMRPRAAALARARRLPWRHAVGEVAAATVAVYPPGTPLVIPGEMITDEAAGWACELKALGAALRGCDEGGDEVWVVDARAHPDGA